MGGEGLMDGVVGEAELILQRRIQKKKSNTLHSYKTTSHSNKSTSHFYKIYIQVRIIFYTRCLQMYATI